MSLAIVTQSTQVRPDLLGDAGLILRLGLVCVGVLVGQGDVAVTPCGGLVQIPRQGQALGSGRGRRSCGRKVGRL